ncbi:uncharacterized protein CDAR_237751 [Caerostris darwini]|uniref:Transcription factor TFIIIC triple barrel domain-containing protein n=1 Tax=Caerostris darwini TaxID=1538125 RepID=A0AAV4S0J9_9ARAC|nr:uncharacterized protein CDAR_237751 [Caerostris darwini]
MDDSDSEYDIEETVVLVELNGIIDTDLLLQPQNPTKAWGIDTDEPIFQIGNCFFKGEYEDTLGTVVFYEPVDTKDASETPENDFEYLCKTDVKLTMRRCFPQDKSVISSKSTESSDSFQIPDKKYKISTGFLSKIKENKTKKKKFLASKLQQRIKHINSKNAQRNLLVNYAKGVSKIKCKSKTSKQPIQSESSKEEIIQINENAITSPEILNSSSESANSFESNEICESPKEKNTQTNDNVITSPESSKPENLNSSTVNTNSFRNNNEGKELKNDENNKTSKKNKKRSHDDIDVNTDANLSSSKKILIIGHSNESSILGTNETSISEENKENLKLNMKDNYVQNNLQSSEMEECKSKKIVENETCFIHDTNVADFKSEIQEKNLISNNSDNPLPNDIEVDCSEVPSISCPDQIKKSSSFGVPFKLDKESSNDILSHTVFSKENTSQLLSICESSADENQLSAVKSVEQIVDDTSSCQENKEEYLKDEKLNMKVNNATEVEKQTICATNLSSKVDVAMNYSSGVHDLSVDPAYESIGNNSDIINPIHASDMILSPEEVGIAIIRNNSYEATQSMNSEIENNDRMSECTNKKSEIKNHQSMENSLQEENIVKNATNEKEDQMKVSYIDSGEYSKSECMTSEISQSQKSVTCEAKFQEEKSGVAFESDRNICSQSTDQTMTSNVAKDMCVSSGIIDNTSEHNENAMKEKEHFHADAECSHWEENTEIVTCEVSQSDKLENISELPEHEIQLLSNECDESNLEENKSSATDGHNNEVTNSIHNPSNKIPLTSNTQITCEVTQSSYSMKSGNGTSLTAEKDNSNECVENQTSELIDKLKDDCVSSGDISNVSAQVETESENTNSEVSLLCNSENRLSEEICVSSDSRAEQNIEREETDFKHICEVSQSVKLDTSSMCNLEPNTNECDETELTSHSAVSFSNCANNFPEEICVSSDDMPAEVMHSEDEGLQSVNNFACEVSQSSRSEESVIFPVGQSGDVEIVSSNECEAFTVCAEDELSGKQQNESEKNVCESSDDINENSTNILQHAINKSQYDLCDEACQSSKSDENNLLSNEAITVQNSDKFEISVRKNNSEDITICESSGDTMAIETNDLEPSSNPCTSSDKLIMESSIEPVCVIDSKDCDSFSNQILNFSQSTAHNENGNNQISQSGSSMNSSSNITLGETENNQISQSGNEVCHSVDVSITENQISQSGNVASCSNDMSVIEMCYNQISQSSNSADCSNDVVLNEMDNNQISQSGATANSSSNISTEETENDQISQSGNTTDCFNDISITQTENNQISQSGSTSIDVISNEMENNQISQSGNGASCSSELENNQITQSGNDTNLSSDVLITEIENNQISQSGNISDPHDTELSESENYQISQSGTITDSSCIFVNETDNNQISQSGNDGSPSGGNNLISQSENDAQNRDIVSLDYSFQVNVSSSSDINSSSYVDVIYSSFHETNSIISSNSEVSPSSVGDHPYICDGSSLFNNDTSTNFRILTEQSSEVSNEIESPPMIPTVPEGLSAQSSVHLTVCSGSVTIVENRETASSGEQEMLSSSSNNEAVGSSLLLNNDRKKSISKITKSNSLDTVDESTSKETPCTSQSLNSTDDRKKESNKPECRRANSTNISNLSDSNLLQSSTLPYATSHFDNKNRCIARPSLLEVMVSSASDFRNSLFSDNNFGKERSYVSSVSEPSTSNAGDEFSESFVGETDVSSENRNNENRSQISQNISIKNSEQINSELSKDKEKYVDSNELGFTHHHVSQSSDIINTHSSAALVSDSISQSSQQDFVQSSSSILRSSVLISNESVSVFDQVSSADENSPFINKNLENSDVTESSNAEIGLPSCSDLTFSSASNRLIESSDDQFASTEDESNFKPELENTESEVSSTPSEVQQSGLRLSSLEENEHSTIKRSLSGRNEILDVSENDVITVEVTSFDSDCALYKSMNSSEDANMEDSNEAEILHRNSLSSSSANRSISVEEIPVPDVETSEIKIESSASSSPVNEHEVFDCEGSSEVSESFIIEQNDMSQSSDNNVSCSVSEFHISQNNLNSYPVQEIDFTNTSCEAESKSSNDYISSFKNGSEKLFSSHNLQSPSNNELSMGEYDDSIQSSLDETHLSINEQIKTISTSPNSSSNVCYEDDIPSNINSFITSSSQSHSSRSYCHDITSLSKINSYSNDVFEIGESSGITTKNSPQITNSEVIIESVDSESNDTFPENSIETENVCSPERHMELSEQEVPVIESYENADLVESSCDQLEENNIRRDEI